ncbi:MAG: DUF4388 domain-containing protein [Bdellovibrionota bacterium]
MSQEALIDMFSSLSQKRRQGALRVAASGGAIQILLNDGKIIGVAKNDGRQAQSICSRLLRAGVIHDKVYKLFQSTQVDVPQLFDLLVSKKFVKPEQFQKARVAYEMDLLHSLRFADDAQLAFSSGDIRVDPRFPFTLSPGQLLLDIAELNADEERFERIFTAERSRVSIARKGHRPKGLSPYEGAVWDSIEQAKKVEQLFQALLSEFEVREGLLALYDQNLLVVSVNGVPIQPDGAVSTSPADPDEDDLSLPDAEDDDIDLYGQIASEAVDSLLDGFEGELDLAELEEVAFDPKPRRAETVKSSAVAPRKAAVEDQAGPSVLRSAETFFSNDVPYVPPPDQHAAVEKSSEAIAPVRERKDFALIIADWNYRLQQPETLQKIILLTILAYLLTVLFACLISGSMIDRWFHVLSEFTSST